MAFNVLDYVSKDKKDKAKQLLKTMEVDSSGKSTKKKPKVATGEVAGETPTDFIKRLGELGAVTDVAGAQTYASNYKAPAPTVTPSTLNIPQGMKDLGYLNPDQSEIDAYNAEQGLTPPTTQPDVTTPSESQLDFINKLKALGIFQTPETTPTDILGNIPKTTDLDKKIQEGEDNLLKIKEELAKPETDEAMRARLTALFQNEIDSLNGVYALQKQEAIKAGLGNLASNSFLQSRKGALGSVAGQSETKNVETENLQNVNAVETARQAAISPIYSKISDEMIKAKKEKQTAQTTSAEAYIENLKGKKEKLATIATNAIRNMILSKVNPTDKDFIDMAKQIGVDPALFKQEYLTAKKDEDASMAKEDFTLSEGQVKFTFDPKTGTYVKTASVPKTYAPEKAGTSSDSNVFKFDTAAKESLLMAGLGGNDMQTIENALNVASPEVVLKNLEAQVKAGAISQAVFDKVSGMIQPKPFNEEGFMSNSFITGLIDEAAVKQDRWNSFESTVKAEIVQKVKDYAAYLKQNNYSPSQIQTELTSYIQNLIK